MRGGVPADDVAAIVSLLGDTDDLVGRLRRQAPYTLTNEDETAMREAAARIEALEAENRDLKESVIAFGAPWAVQCAKQGGLPDGHLHATHYEILAAAGARMDAFTRHEDIAHAD